MPPSINFLSSGLLRECLYQRDYKCLITVIFDLQRLGNVVASAKVKKSFMRGTRIERQWIIIDYIVIIWSVSTKKTIIPNS